MKDMQKLNMQIPKQENSRPFRHLKDLNLMDDFLFDVTTMNLEACKIIIELSLGIRLKSLKWKEGQKEIRNLPGKRGIRMDFSAEDEEGICLTWKCKRKMWGIFQSGHVFIRHFWMHPC